MIIKTIRLIIDLVYIVTLNVTLTKYVIKKNKSLLKMFHLPTINKL